MSFKTRLALSMSAFAFVLPLAAHAEDAPASSFVFKPSVTVSESYDDNMYTERTNPDDGFYTKITPEMTLEAGSTFKTKFNAGLTQYVYDDAHNNRLDFTTGLKANTALTDALAWEGALDYKRGHSERGDADADPTNDVLHPPVFTAFKANTALTYKFGSFTLKPRLGLTSYNFEDGIRSTGAVRDQDFRDRDEYIIGGRATATVNENFDLFADGEYNPRTYTFDSVASERSSTGGTYQIGASFKPMKGMKLDLAGGYMTRDYDKTMYRSIYAPYYAASWQWAITDATTIGASLDRLIMEVTDTGASGSVRTISKINLTQKLTDNLTAKLEGRLTHSGYEGGNGATNGTDRSDNLYETTANLSYALGHGVSLAFDYAYGNKDSNRDAADVKRHVVTLGVTYGF